MSQTRKASLADSRRLKKRVTMPNEIKDSFTDSHRDDGNGLSTKRNSETSTAAARAVHGSTSARPPSIIKRGSMQSSTSRIPHQSGNGGAVPSRASQSRPSANVSSKPLKRSYQSFADQEDASELDSSLGDDDSDVYESGAHDEAEDDYDEDSPTLRAAVKRSSRGEPPKRRVSRKGPTALDLKRKEQNSIPLKSKSSRLSESNDPRQPSRRRKSPSEDSEEDESFRKSPRCVQVSIVNDGSPTSEEWSAADQAGLEKTSASEVALWRKTEVIFNLSPPELLPDGTGVSTENNTGAERHEDDEETHSVHMNWSNNFSQRFGDMLCCPGFEGDADRVRHAISLAIWYRHGKEGEAPDLSNIMAQKHRKFIQDYERTLNQKSRNAYGRLSSEEKSSLLQTLRQHLPSKPQAMEFLKYLEDEVRDMPAIRGKNVVRNPTGFSARDAAAIGKAWDKYAATKKVSVKSMKAANDEHPNPRGPPKAGELSHRDKALASKKAWIIQNRRIRAGTLTRRAGAPQKHPSTSKRLRKGKAAGITQVRSPSRRSWGDQDTYRFSDNDPVIDSQISRSISAQVERNDFQSGLRRRIWRKTKYLAKSIVSEWITCRQFSHWILQTPVS